VRGPEEPAVYDPVHPAEGDAESIVRSAEWSGESKGGNGDMGSGASGINKTKYLIALIIFILSILVVLRVIPVPGMMYRSVFIVSLAFSVTYLLTPVVAATACRLGVVDIPNERKVHSNPTPLLGGAAIFIAFALSTLLTFWYSSELKGVMLAATIVFLVGLLDDIFNLSSVIRLLAQIGAVFVLFGYGMEIDFIPDPTGIHLFKKAVTIVWIIGITNAVNFLDGLDGLCVGFGAIASLTVGMIAFLTNQYFLMFLSFSLAGSCMGFLPWNFRRN
jgi:UDP-GlcNAc:undecaprenyl-phosphate/decaprenyl-phosphate GlcNAc-1-phosphate transferase